MNSLIILRGLPGSGKTTLANLLSENKWPVFSIDSYFTDPITKEYNFQFDKNHLAYKNCEEQTKQAMQNKTEKIFIDNVFSIDWEIEPYFKLASENDYSVFVVTVENHHGKENMHNISSEQIQKMAAKYKVKLL
ncbi:MAG: AAA family ATPase [Bacteroidetes bacterium]|nr:AAA family ATPase [Bacteroidota bacterium]